jgi:hypothetical protein
VLGGPPRPGGSSSFSRVRFAPGTRPLGIPTVADRCAQEVVRRYLEPILEAVFHPDSYGYRPGKSAIDAVRQARRRCWRYGGSSSYELPVGAALRRTLAEGSGADGGRQCRAAYGRNSSGWGRDAPYAKGNFTFDRVICGWGRGLTVLDLRLKR